MASSTAKPHRRLDKGGKLLQRGKMVPLLDAYRAILFCADRLNVVADAPDASAICVDLSSLERLIVGLVRVDPLQSDHVEQAEPLGERIAASQKVIRGCHAAANAIASVLAKNPRLAFEEFKGQLAASPDPALTLKLSVRRREWRSGPCGCQRSVASNRVLTECALLPAASRKSSLTLQKVLEPRHVMDELRAVARELGHRLDDPSSMSMFSDDGANLERPTDGLR